MENGKVIEIGGMRVNIGKDAMENWYFTVTDKDGSVILFSSAFGSRRDCERAMHKFRATAWSNRKKNGGFANA